MDAIASEIVKGGEANQVMFLDLKIGRDDKPFITITSIGRAEDGTTERRSVRIPAGQILPTREALMRLSIRYSALLETKK